MKSIWLAGTSQKEESTFEKNCHTTVCIIGAGIFGLSTAYYLTNLGLDVIVIDTAGIACKTTGHTTAKVTSQHGLIYHYLVNRYGTDFARLYFTANESAIREIGQIIADNGISCDFVRNCHTMFTTSFIEKKKLQEELSALKKITENAEEVKTAELPFLIEAGVCMKDQAQFHPVKYANGLAKAISEKGGRIELGVHCNQLEKEKAKYKVLTDKGDILADYVVIATHYPFVRFPGWYFLKMYQSTSYAIGIEANDAVLDNMYLQVENPYHSFRSAIDNEGRKILIIGGEDHKTGKAVTRQMTYGKLKQFAKEYYPNSKVLYEWSTRDCITLDKIPYIGEFSNLYPNLYVGTGFNKWGMTSSNVAARIVTDEILGKHSPYADIFKATRLKPIRKSRRNEKYACKFC